MKRMKKKRTKKTIIKAQGFIKSDNIYEQKINTLKEKFIDNTIKLPWKRELLIVVVEDIDLWLTTKNQYLLARNKKKQS